MVNSVCIRVPINSGESIFGYLARVAEANGYDSSTWLLPTAQRMSFNTSKWTMDTIEHVTQITSLPRYEVANRVYANTSNNQLIFFGDRIPSVLVDQPYQEGTRKFCPDCLRETGFHSALFDLTPVQVCPQHACRLTTVCPLCAKKVFWGRPTLVTCKACGGDLTAAQTERVPTSELRGLAAIAKRFGFPHRHPDIAGQNLEFADELSHLSSGGVLQLMITFAGYLGHRSNPNNFLYAKPQMRASLHRVLDIGLPFVQRWPEGLFEFLELYASAHGKNVNKIFGLKKSFASFYNLLIRQSAEPWLTVKASFSDYVENHWTGACIPRTYLGPDKVVAHYSRVTVAETCRILGFSPQKVHSLINRGILRASSMGSGRGLPILVEREDIEKIAPNGRKPLSLSELGRRLGLSRKINASIPD